MQFILINAMRLRLNSMYLELASAEHCNKTIHPISIIVYILKIQHMLYF